MFDEGVLKLKDWKCGKLLFEKVEGGWFGSLL
jgi:hypothetical protein